MTETRTLPGSVSEPTLYVAFELGKKDWKLAMTSGFGVEPWLRTWQRRSGRGRARDRAGPAAVRFPAAAPVVSCYEAGRDGFWIHRALRPGGRESCGGFGEHRGESPGAAGEDRSARRAEAGADAGARLLRRARGVERGACADRGGRSRAPGQSGADGADAGSDAAGQSDARVAGDLGGVAAGAPARTPGGRPCAIGRARPCRRKCKRGWRARRRGCAALEAQIAELDAQQQAAVTRRGPRQRRAAAGAAQGRGDDERVGVAR